MGKLAHSGSSARAAPSAQNLASRRARRVPRKGSASGSATPAAAAAIHGRENIGTAIQASHGSRADSAASSNGPRSATAAR
jgi:hypothetical protein